MNRYLVWNAAGSVEIDAATPEMAVARWASEHGEERADQTVFVKGPNNVAHEFAVKRVLTHEVRYLGPVSGVST